MSDTQTTLTGGRRLARNVLWNLFGTGAPVLVAIAAIPVLIESMGTARFGVLTLAWTVVGYFSLFDLGLGRALTKLVAEKLGTGRNVEIPSLVRTALLLMLILGVLGGIVALLLTPWFVGSVLKIPLDLQSETATSFYLLAISIPVVILTTGLRGVLEAHQLFGFVNVVRIPLGLITFLGPVAVMPFSNSLVPVVVVLVASRLVATLAYGILCYRVEPALRHATGVDRTTTKALISFGGWMTVTNIVSPLLVYLDRFLIGAVISMAAVAYYATPYEVVTKFLIIPGALMGVMFPAFATALAEDRARADRLFARANNYIFIALFPLVLITVTFASEGLTFWIGSEFAANSALVLQLLAIGVFINSQAQVPFGMILGAGRPDITAKLHLAELAFYLPFLWWLLGAYGIVGAAIAWVARTAIDTLALFFVARGPLASGSRFLWRVALMFAVAFVALGLGAFTSGLIAKGLYLLLVLLVFAIATWFFILQDDERNMIRHQLARGSIN
jgi:O-antigen/teichoic acid export membrane protein